MSRFLGLLVSTRGSEKGPSVFFFLLLGFISSYDLAKTFISDRKDV